ncbi:gustatory receptor for sugar taste 64f-like isoform X2 [Choristoneura fumiferana]|uniref:gustatory receptor for sugar taste 64f-like isoform X2 n=1 Tax=Choristoneura fumiferana TaxID=7141 RepID=UPI003D15E569
MHKETRQGTLTCRHDMKIVLYGRYPLSQLQIQKQMVLVNGNNVTCIQMLQPEEMNKADSLRKNVTLWISKKNKVHAAKPKRTIKRESFEESLKTIMIIGHCFGLMPVDGLINSKKRGVSFSWISWRCLYSSLLFMGQIFMCLMCFNDIIQSSASLNVTTPAIFYSSTCITMAMFLHVASNWPKLIKHVVKTEDLDPNMDTSLTFKCNMTCAIVLTLALLEHILSLVSAFTGAMVCYPNTNVYEGFVKFFYPWVFKFLPYTTLLGMITQATFIWNFSDLFVICMSYYLTSRLENINKKLILVQGKYLSELFWRSTREDYGRATQLVRKIDEVISGIVFISFANNLFFVCLQLFNTLEDGIKGTGECRGNRLEGKSPFGGYEAGAYFLFSLIYLISRSIAVSLIASQVNSASTVAAPILYDVPSPVYCIEVQRFIDQVNGDKVALSGLQFFTVTRGLLLTIAGTIVTYELVMFQFKTPQQPAGSQSTPNVTN